ncbi:YbcC family protein [Novosphingobium ginsenosidimutans]|uniref:Probable inorganic carbon transporter subunit DabA n=1 Tax=Novosphingobium ginsenosidimutans TaxID=1176536 RepID=A0A5B8S705_9SPHN|nr:DUF2309 domain-containing protein [Novosphingobium ginsenosidimutans]QEA17389.1 DUF2309 domain-containing protein [Novosphingobium ginsenosidimutans]
MTAQFSAAAFEPIAVTTAIREAIDHAVRQVPPAWPLASSVAVNPFLGQTGETLADAAARLRKVGGVPVTMPRDWYRERIANGSITEADLAAALAASRHPAKPANLAELQAAIALDRPAPAALANVAELAAKASGTDWPGIVADRMGSWLAGYFDEGQALWPVIRGHSAWAAWRSNATHDLTPEIMGLHGFARIVAEAPQDPLALIGRAVNTLDLDEAALASYFHQLLLTLGGWAQYARYKLWQAELRGDTDMTLADLLAIRLLWEESLYLQHQTAITHQWAAVRADHGSEALADADDLVDEILQEATERASQRELAESLAMTGSQQRQDQPALQAAFCIDVRSEVYRRALESVDSAIQTIGFAGFFGVATEHRGFASDTAEHRLPVLLNPALQSVSGDERHAAQDQTTRFALRAKRAWGRFKLAAVSSFAFVEATGPLYAVKLLRDALGLHGTKAPNEPMPRLVPDLTPDARISAAETILKAMSLTARFAPIVLIAGHGANVTNNPHASGLNCGACGGYSGEVNARLLAGLLNDRAVRAGLAERGIHIPQGTAFIAALHDTTTDRVTLYDGDLSEAAPAGLNQVRTWLDNASALARAERAARLPHADGQADIARRARDWAEVRPEWGLAGCKAFIAAPRARTHGCALDGRAFLHDYDWRKDATNGFAVLELILTAPVVVASWISLQYYGSTVAPAAFGAGNKLLHNVVGGIGVLEGNGGNMRAGLAWQSVHDGEKLMHEPLRLSVCLEAPVEAVTAVLEKHPQVRALFDNRWLHLFVIADNGQLAKRYAGNLSWQDEPHGSD